MQQRDQRQQLLPALGLLSFEHAQHELDWVNRQPLKGESRLVSFLLQRPDEMGI